MKNEPDIPIKKPTPFSKKSTQINISDFSKALGKLGYDIALVNLDSLIDHGIDAFKALGLGTSAEGVAWLLVYRSLIQAMKKLIDEQIELKLDKSDIKNLQKQINDSLAKSNLSINNHFFEHPEQSEIIRLVQPRFAEQLKEVGLNTAEASAISQRLPIYFATALHDEWGNRSQDYLILEEKLDTPFTQANERAQAQLHYAAWLQKQVEEPLFLEAFSLKQVFVPLRAYRYSNVTKDGTEKLEESEEKTSDGQSYIQRVVVDLESALEQWIHEAKRDDAIRLISGGPGSGKSSVTKMFAAKLAAEGTISVLFIPLHRFNVSDNLVDAVGEFAETDGFLPYNPLSMEYRANRLLIIFDGLDELSMQGKIAENTAQAFVWEVQRRVEQFNHEKTYVQVLITGREVVVQTNENAFREQGQILYVLPYFVAKDSRKQYVDSQGQLQHDQRELWWQHYGKASGSGHTGLPPELDKNNLTEITAQPLLNYLVALGLHYGKLSFSEETNLNAVYADLLKSIHKRRWTRHQHPVLRKIEKEDFEQVLEEIALTAWHGDGRTTTVKEIEEQCNNSLKPLLARFQRNLEEDTRASVIRLLIAFYFRQSDQDNTGEKTFEFTHKSFGEYLTARRIVREVRSIHETLKAGERGLYGVYDEEDALYSWILLCGLSTMDEYLFNFVLDEIRLQYMQNPDEVANWQQMFCYLVGFMIRRGMPMERLNPRPSFQEEERQSRNAADSLLAVLGALQHITREISKIPFPSSTAFGTLLARLNGQRLNASNPMSFSCLSYLDLGATNLQRANLQRANLQGTVLQRSILQGTILEEVNLQTANLREANLTGADLTGADLTGATLQEVNLTRADLTGAILHGTNLARANFQEANLQEADLTGADLTGVILWAVDIRGVDLREVCLQGTDLREADLTGADLTGADLTGADLTGATLQICHLKRIDLTRAILRGTNLMRADLTEANLMRADLTGAILHGTNLTKADLTGAILRKVDLQRTILQDAILQNKERSTASDHLE